MKFWKKSLVAGLLVSGGLWLGACGNENQAQDQTDGTVLTVSTWNYDTTPEFDKLFRAFEKENPGVTVKPVDIASDDYDTKLTTMLASGDSTDVLTMKNL